MNRNTVDPAPATASRSLHKPLALAIALALGAGALAAASAQAAEAVRYDIAGGPLAEVLGRFASAAGVALSFDAAQLRGRQSAGLHGSYDVTGGFSALLVGSGLQAEHQANGSYVLRPVPTDGAVALSASTITASLGAEALPPPTPAARWPAARAWACWATPT